MKTKETAPDDTAEGVDMVMRQAAESSLVLAQASDHDRARLLDLIAEYLRKSRESLIAKAAEETALEEEILGAEVERTAAQFEFFADVLRDGRYREIEIDNWKRPDGTDGSSRRWLVPLGAVGVFGSSNFPFAYGVGGGDTASAIASGCAVVAKEHPSHPETARAVSDILRSALRNSGFPEESVGLVRGLSAGQDLVKHPLVRAVGFTGSVAGGKALFDICAARSSPVPFFGELGSVNPVVVLPVAGRDRGAEIGEEVASAVLVRGGQVCTRPGIVFVPREGGDGVVDSIQTALDESGPVSALNNSIANVYASGISDRAAALGFQLPLAASDRRMDPRLFEVHSHAFASTDLELLREECFGPTVVVVRYDETTDLRAALSVVPPRLVSAIFADPADEVDVAPILQALTSASGRVVWNSGTTTLKIGRATHHGGGYPASTAEGTTSVGAHAIRRWLRPVAFEGLPMAVLPEALRD